MHVIEIDKTLCKGCSLCCYFCTEKGLRVLAKSKEMSEQGSYLPKLQGECRGCRWCEIACPEFAITVRKDEKC